METLAQSANVFGNDNIVVQASGSGVNVSIGAQPHLRLTRYVNQTRLEIQRESETAWLSAYRTDVVPLIGREGAKGELRAWLNREAPVSVRVLVGAGGRGKTRLALELAREVSGEGWLAGFATADNFDRFRRQNGVEDWRWDKPVLVILDYAASRAEQLRAWVRELVDASFDGRPSLRLLLLERQANPAIGWHATVFGLGDDPKSRAANALLDPQDPIELPALDELDFRRQVFGALLGRANATLEAPSKGDDPEFDRLLGDHKWAGDPLYLMMAGLAAAKAGVKSALTLSRADLALSMGRNELDRIGRIGAARGVDKQSRFAGAFVRHMAAIATLLQGVTTAEARELATKEIDALRSTADLDATVDALTDALPASDTTRGVAPILPDILGEGAILAWFGPNGGLAAGGVDAAGRVAAAASASVGKASATLVRIAQDFAEAGYAEPIQWLDALAGAPDADLGALMEIADALPYSTVSLREIAVTLTRRIADLARDGAEAEQRAGSGDQRQAIFAVWVTNLGARLNYLGRHEEALATAQQGVDIRRRLAAARPDALLPDLADSLNNLSVCLSELGRREEALAVAQEATDIYHSLAATRPGPFSPNLANTLSNLGSRLRELGLREEALAATREATDILRRVAAARPDAYLPDLAFSLNNLGNHLSELGRHEEALAAAQQSVDIRRRLAAARPDALLPDLALSLNNLGNRLSELGRSKEALVAAQQSVDIRRRLAAPRPDAFLPDLAMSLNNLGKFMGELGRREDALNAAQEVTDIFRRLAAARPDVHLPRLALSLNNLGAFLSQLGRPEQALPLAQEATDICRRLAAARPDAFLPDLASLLNNLGNSLGELGRSEEALAASREAVDIRRRLAAARPDAFLPDLADSLISLGNGLGALGRPEEALAASQEAVNIRRRLAAARPDAFLPDLALSLNNLGNSLGELGRNEEALATTREAVDIRRHLAAALPDAFLSDLADSLSNLSARLGALGQHEDAFAAAQEAADFNRRLAAARPDTFLPNLAGSLNNLSSCLGKLGRSEEALASVQEAVATLRPFFLKLPAAYGQWMTIIARHYVRLSESLGVEPDAELLGPIVEAFEKLEGSEEDADPNA